MAYDPVGHPLVVAHRGASASAPENTVAAFALAVAQDADGVELDLRRTADGVLIVHHDPHLDDGTAIVDLRLAEIRAHAPHVPTLDEVAAVTGDLLLNIEIKNHPNEPDYALASEIAAQVVSWIDTMDMHWRALVTSFDREAIAHVRHLDPNHHIQTGQLLETSDDLTPTLGEIAARHHQWALPQSSAFDLDPSIAEVAHHHGLKVMTWTVDDPATLLSLANLGVDGIITNTPAEAYALLSN